jgi:predicted P-loop ATPase
MSTAALSLSERLPSEVTPHLHWTKEGKIFNNAHNWHSILTNDPRLNGRLRFNSFSMKAALDGRDVNTNAIVGLALWIARHYFICPSTKPFGEVVAYAAQTSGSFDPLREWVEGLPPWDTTERIDGFLQKVGGARDTPLIRRMSRCFFLSCIQRALFPGVKVDTVLILQGDQRMGKSTAAQALCPQTEWFSSSQSNLKIGDRDAVYCIQGKWIFEIAELDSFRGKSATALKAFFSEQVDRVRPQHGRFFEDLPRRTIFIGTTNEVAFLRDYTGSRRFHPVHVTKMDIEYIKQHRLQLWAEAKRAVLAGEPHWFSDEEEDLLKTHNEAYQEIDPWEDPISEYMETVIIPTMSDVLSSLGLKPKEQDKRAQIRAGAILRRLSYHSQQTRSNGVRKQVWIKEVKNGSTTD